MPLTQHTLVDIYIYIYMFFFFTSAVLSFSKLLNMLLLFSS